MLLLFRQVSLCIRAKLPVKYVEKERKRNWEKRVGVIELFVAARRNKYERIALYVPLFTSKKCVKCSDENPRLLISMKSHYSYVL